MPDPEEGRSQPVVGATNVKGIQVGNFCIQFNFYAWRHWRFTLVTALTAIAAIVVVASTGLLPFHRSPVGAVASSGSAAEPSGQGGDGDVASSGAGERAGSAAMESARAECAPSSKSVRIGDRGHTLIISRAVAEKRAGIDKKSLYCILGKLEVPASIVFHIENTTSMSGIQSADFNGLSAVWGYSPDDGLNMTVTDAAGLPSSRPD